MFTCHVHRDRGIGGRESGKHAGQALVLIGGADQSLHRAGHLRRLPPLKVFQLVFEAAAGRQTDDRRQVEGEDTRGTDLLRAAEHLADHHLGAVGRGRAVGEGFQLDHHERGIGLIAAVQQGESDDRQHALHLRHGLDQFFNLLHDGASAVHRRTIGKLDGNEECALVFLRQEPCRG